MSEVAAPYPPATTATAGLPGPVRAAVVVTWIGSALTAGLTVLSVGLWLVVFHSVFDAFASGSGNPRWWLVCAAVVVVTLSAVAALLARGVFRGNRRAYWALLGLSLVAVVGGVYLIGFVFPAIAGSFALVVVILLLLPRSRAWAWNPTSTPESSGSAV